MTHFFRLKYHVFVNITTFSKNEAAKNKYGSLVYDDIWYDNKRLNI